MKKYKLKHRIRFNNIKIVLLLLVFMTIGYALNKTTLSISGNTQINPSWNLSLINTKIIDGSVDASFGELLLDDNSGLFTLEISKVEINSLEEYLEFEFEIKNDGLMNVSLASPNLIVNEEDYQKYFKTSITYSDGTIITNGDVIQQGTSKKFIGKIELNNSSDVNLADILEYNSDNEKTTITYSVSLKFTQA